MPCNVSNKKWKKYHVIIVSILLVCFLKKGIKQFGKFEKNIAKLLASIHNQLILYSYILIFSCIYEFCLVLCQKHFFYIHTQKQIHDPLLSLIFLFLSLPIKQKGGRQMYDCQQCSFLCKNKNEETETHALSMLSF